MTARERLTRNQGRAGQGGFTLIEVLITIAIGAVIMVPLLAWMTLGYQTQVSLTNNSSRTAARNLVASYLPRDVGAATSVDPVPTDCANPVPGGAGAADRVVLSMVAAGASPVRTVYLVRPVDAESAVLVRRTCTGSQVEDIELVERVDLPMSTSVAAACEGPCNQRFGRVNLSIRLVDGRGTINVTASRRIGSDS